MRLWIWLGLVMLGCGVARAQALSKQQQMPPPGVVGVPVRDDPERAKQQQQLEHMIVDERRKRILSDTDKLLALATELKAEVDKSTKNELSMEVVKKAAEIEKLAHEVKERMRN